MGIFDFFSSSPEKKVAKAKKVMLNEHHQYQVRQQAIYDLGQIDHEASIHALVERLGVNFRDTIKNEQEREWVRHLLVEQFQERAIEPLKQFISETEISTRSISGAIQVLRELISDDELTSFLVTTLQSHAPSNHRSVEVRLQLIDALEDQEGEIVAAIMPYTADHSDDVRVKVITLLELRLRGIEGDHREVISALLQAMTDPFASGRITRNAAKAIVKIGASLSAFKDELDAESIPEGYRLKGDRLIATEG
jgi:HEAT repeat protein